MRLSGFTDNIIATLRTIAVYKHCVQEIEERTYQKFVGEFVCGIPRKVRGNLGYNDTKKTTGSGETNKQGSKGVVDCNRRH